MWSKWTSARLKTVYRFFFALNGYHSVVLSRSALWFLIFLSNNCSGARQLEEGDTFWLRPPSGDNLLIVSFSHRFFIWESLKPTVNFCFSVQPCRKASRSQCNLKWTPKSNTRLNRRMVRCSWWIGRPWKRLLTSINTSLIMDGTIGTAVTWCLFQSPSQRRQWNLWYVGLTITKMIHQVKRSFLSQDFLHGTRISSKSNHPLFSHCSTRHIILE